MGYGVDETYLNVRFFRHLDQFACVLTGGHAIALVSRQGLRSFLLYFLKAWALSCVRNSQTSQMLTVCSYHVTYAFQSESTSIVAWMSRNFYIVCLRTRWLWVWVSLQSEIFFSVVMSLFSSLSFFAILKIQFLSLVDLTLWNWCFTFHYILHAVPFWCLNRFLYCHLSLILSKVSLFL